MSIFLIYRRLNRFFGLEKETLDFKKFAKKSRRAKRKTNKVILVENRRFPIDYIALLAFLPSAVDYYDSNVVVYEIILK